MIALLRDINQRGHEIGQHSSFFSYDNAELLRSERTGLQVACETMGINSQVSGNRQHYLRFRTETTPTLLNDAGFEYDASGGFAEHPGFRYGTAKSFRMWDFSTGRPLRLRQHPLIVMECSIINYMGHGYSDEAWNMIRDLKVKTVAFGGTFSVLWHNSHLTTPEAQRFFTSLFSL